MAVKASAQVSIVDVSDGQTGATGKGISSTSPEYYLSSSKTEQTGGNWSTIPPTWTSGKYLWVRQVVKYTDNTTSTTNAYCDTSWEAVNELQIGGRNLFLNSSFHNDCNQWSPRILSNSGVDSVFTNLQYATKYNKQCAYIHSQNLNERIIVAQSILDKVEPDTTYTFSGWVLTENIIAGTTDYFARLHIDGAYNDGNSLKSFMYGTDAAFTANAGKGTWEHLSYTFTTDKDKLSAAVSLSAYVYARDLTGDIYFCDLKLEKGNKATDWSPAPEDVNHAIDNIQVGGRNLLLNTGESSTIIGENKPDQCLAHHDLACGSITKLEAGEYTCSADIVGTVEGGTAHMQFYGPPWETIPEMSGNVTIKTTKQKIGGTFTLASPQSFSATGMRVRTDNVSGTITVSNMKLEKGNKATDWSPAPEDVEADATKKANEAAKTATNHMKLLENGSGLVIGNMTAGTLGKNVLIDVDSVDIRNGDTVLASYGDNIIWLGKNSSSSQINLCNGAGYITSTSDSLFGHGLTLASSNCVYICSNDNTLRLFSNDTLTDSGNISDIIMNSTNIQITNSSSVGNVMIGTNNLYMYCNKSTITGTLVLSKTTDASGKENKSPALIVGGTAETAHIEIDSNEIMAKSNSTTPTGLTLNNDGGNVYIGNGGSGNLIGICQIVKMGSKPAKIKYQSGRTKALIEFWKTSIGSSNSHTVYDSAYVTGLSNKMTAKNVNVSNGPDFSFTYSISKDGEISVSGTFSKYRITYFN